MFPELSRQTSHFPTLNNRRLYSKDAIIKCYLYFSYKFKSSGLPLGIRDYRLSLLKGYVPNI